MYSFIVMLRFESGAPLCIRVLPAPSCPAAISASSAKTIKAATIAAAPAATVIITTTPAAQHISQEHSREKTAPATPAVIMAATPAATSYDTDNDNDKNNKDNYRRQRRIMFASVQSVRFIFAPGNGYNRIGSVIEAFVIVSGLKSRPQLISEYYTRLRIC